mmetsp:Transcript_9828/g.18357  ORF Transcript_9828/g.18357 Transcript_9828/m.18357 type:complete len:628 (-) Transcript_9828:336-2219(-)|eukprot:CAMPEP_0175052108 /NCGR_PEP_ID=MMETSP0052_2-20121109/8178_1 /TAXON_ID=51329 ORGANISM="Polytomella parva, Strain SAG 63-3" /NCGR_SAMPLE_ID=MMETSP0052_2 /ASSEMBLY_ACC=CAM_ASM_000194 /LENGTH=627 /DNA_ID=CAMNT_0016316479 /DNA_START=164 /DNA_END=2047 /DNA_ORIENTATION=-
MSLSKNKVVDPRKIFLPFVPSYISRDDLKLIFERHGTVTNAIVLPNKIKSGLIGFVTYQNEKDCRDVLKSEFMSLESGQKLKVVPGESIVRRNKEKSSTPRDDYHDSSSSDDGNTSISSKGSTSSHCSNISREQRQSRYYQDRNRPNNNQGLRRDPSAGPSNNRRRHTSRLRDRSTSRPRQDPSQSDCERQSSKIPSKDVPLTDLCIVIRDIFNLKFLPNGQPYAAASLCRQLKSIMDSTSNNSSMDQRENNRNESFRTGRDRSLPRRPDSSDVSKPSNSLSSNAEENAFLNMQFLMKTRSLFESFKEAQEPQIMSSALRMYMFSNLIWLDEFLCRESRDSSSNTNNGITEQINELQKSLEKIKYSLCKKFLNDAKKTLENLITAVHDKVEETKSWQMFSVALIINVLEDTFKIIIGESKVVKKLGYVMIGRLLRFINDKTYDLVIGDPEKWLTSSSSYFLQELPNALSFFLQRVSDWEKKNSPKERIGREPSYDSDGSTSSKTKSEDELEDFISDLREEIEHLTQLRRLLRSKEKYFEAAIVECPDISNKIITCITKNYNSEGKKDFSKFEATINKRLIGRKSKDIRFERLDDDFMDGKRLFRKVKPVLQKLKIELADEKERPLFF